MKDILLVAIATLLFAACNQDKLPDRIDEVLQATLSNASPTGDYSHFLLPTSENLADIPQPAYNPLTPEKIELGEQLFYETCFSIAPMHNISRGTYSCASCHIPDAGFMPGRIQGIADGGIGFGRNGEGRDKGLVYDESELDVQGIRPLSLINVAYVKNTSWNAQFGAGGVNEGTEDRWGINDPGTIINELGMEGLESQNIAGIDLHRMVFNQEEVERNGYTDLFNAAFPDWSVEDRYTARAASFALSSYLRNVLANQAPFQKYLRGDCDALTSQQKEGALLFFNKAGCYRCHNEPNLGSVRFYALGVKDLTDAGGFQTDENDKKNFGRGAFTGLPEDDYKFKIPQLYNLKNASFFFHGSSKTSLREVVDYFNDGIPENSRVPSEQISALFRPLQLTDTEVEAITVFLEEALYDNQMDRYVPESVLSGNCFPNNDALSKVDLGCE